MARRASLLVALYLLTSAATAHGQGWYLMMPPLLGEGRVDLDAPFSSWMQLQAFDSVSRCENERLLWAMLARANDDASIERAAQHFMFSNNPPPAMRAEDLEAARERARRFVREQAEQLRKNNVTKQASQAQCVSVADPRLAPRK